MRYLLVLLAFPVLCCTVPAFADTLRITGSFTENSAGPDPANPLELLGGTFYYSFTVPSNPTPDPNNTDSGAFTIPVSDLTVTCDDSSAMGSCASSTLSYPGASVGFFDDAEGGLIQINFLSDLSTNSYPLSLSLAGQTVFTGDPLNPTIVPGVYRVIPFVSDDTYYPVLVDQENGIDVTASDVTITEAAVTPEPGTLALTLSGGLAGGAALRRRRRHA